MNKQIGRVFMEGEKLAGYIVIDNIVYTFGSVKHHDKYVWDLYPSKNVDESTREEKVELIPEKE